MAHNDTPAKTVSRLKASGLIPKDIAVRFIYHHSPNAEIRWEAENAVTGEQLKVGGTAPRTEMAKREWTARERDGWVLLDKGDPLPKEGK